MPGRLKEASVLSFYGPEMAAAPAHPMPYVLGGAGISERPQTPPRGPARDPRARRPPLLSPFWLPAAILGYCNLTVLIRTDHPNVRTGVTEQTAKSEAGRTVKRVPNVARCETGSKFDRDSP